LTKVVMDACQFARLALDETVVFSSDLLTTAERVMFVHPNKFDVELVRQVYQKVFDSNVDICIDALRRVLVRYIKADNENKVPVLMESLSILVNSDNTEYKLQDKLMKLNGLIELDNLKKLLDEHWTVDKENLEKHLSELITLKGDKENEKDLNFFTTESGILYAHNNKEAEEASLINDEDSDSDCGDVFGITKEDTDNVLNELELPSNLVQKVDGYLMELWANSCIEHR